MCIVKCEFMFLQRKPVVSFLRLKMEKSPTRHPMTHHAVQGQNILVTLDIFLHLVTNTDIVIPTVDGVELKQIAHVSSI